MMRIGLLAACLSTGVACAEVVSGEEEETGLLSWTWREQGISIQLIQRLPDQTRAFFLGRGFGNEGADLVGRSCVFQTIFRNDGSDPVGYDLNAWSVLHQGRRLDPKTREAWDGEWSGRGIEETPRIAFRWSLLPTIQRFEPGDYNWGMISFGPAPGEVFDLSVVVDIGGDSRMIRIEGLVCAADS